MNRRFWERVLILLACLGCAGLLASRSDRAFAAPQLPQDSSYDYETTDNLWISIDDVDAPTGSVFINNNNNYTNEVAVSIQLSAQDNGTGVYAMKVSDRSDFQGAVWKLYWPVDTWTFSGVDGVKTIYARFRDFAGNESITYQDDIVLDRAAPNGSIQINAGAVYTNYRQVVLNLSADDLSGISQMCLWNDQDTLCTGEGFTPVKSWTLADIDGSRTVHVKMRDGAENTVVFSDNIVLDRVPPDSAVQLLPALSGTTFMVHWQGSDATSGIDHYNVQYREGAVGSWQEWLTGTSQTSATFIGEVGKTYNFRSQAVDRAGNVEAWPSSLNGDATTTVTIRVFLPSILH